MSPYWRLTIILIVALALYVGSAKFWPREVVSVFNKSKMAVSQSEYPTSQIQDAEIEKTEIVNVSDAAISFRPIKVVNKLDEIKDLLTKALNSQVGQKKIDASGIQKLIVDGEVIFEGYEIGRATKSTSGIVAISSYKNAGRLIENADLDTDRHNGRIDAVTSEVWLVLRDGARRRVSLNNMHAKSPCISPDGSMIAYSGAILSGDGVPLGSELYIHNMINGATTKMPLHGKGKIAPLFWDGDVLAIYNGGEEEMGNAEIQFYEISN